MKRFFATLTVTSLLLLSFAGCSKKTPGETPDATPTPSVSEETPATPTPIPQEETENVITGSISFGGDFTGEEGNISVYLGQAGWEVLGVLFSDGKPVMLSGPLTYKEGVTFTYSDAENELSFIYSERALEIKNIKGTSYACFDGVYSRDSAPLVDTSSPEDVSAKEYLGRIALAHHAISADDLLEYTLDFSESVYDDEYMTRFILIYTDMFLLRGAEIYSDLSNEVPYYPMAKDTLNILLVAASAGNKSLESVNLTNDSIVLKDDMYYIPCLGNAYGEITDPNAHASYDTLVGEFEMSAYFARRGEDSHEFTFTLQTSANDMTSTGVQIDSVIIKEK